MATSRFVGYLIDTNILRALVEQNPFVLAHYRNVFAEQIAIPVVVYAEEIRGWVNPPSNDEKKADICYRMLTRYLAILKRHEILPYTYDAQVEFDKLPPNIGARDKRIAACAIAHNFRVVTNNIKHFEQLLPKDQFVDWTIDPKLYQD